MICPKCHGSSIIVYTDKFDWLNVRVRSNCPECQGTGIIHCCEGLQEQPSKDKDDDMDTKTP